MGPLTRGWEWILPAWNADRFVAQLSSAAVVVLALLCHNARNSPTRTYKRKPKANSV